MNFIHDGGSVCRGVDIFEQNHKFIAAKARYRIGCPDTCLKTLGDLFQQKVTHRVTIVVIDKLEFIQIKVEYREPKPIATGPVEGGLDAVPEQSPIGQVGKLIVERHMLQMVQQLFPLNGGSGLRGDKLQ